MKMKTILSVLVVLVVLGLLIQLIPLPGRGNNPPVVSEPNWDSLQTRKTRLFRLPQQRNCMALV
jgi:hypothetical protein